MKRISTNLWFDGDAEEAAAFYVSVFPCSEITHTRRNVSAGVGEEGSVVTVSFVLDGMPFTAINGGPQFTFDEAVSFAIECDDQAETDRYWSALTCNGGSEAQCGWLKDRFGLSWQVFPTELADLLADPDPERAARAQSEMFRQKKIDVAAIRRAAEGTGDVTADGAGASVVGVHGPDE